MSGYNKTTGIFELTFTKARYWFRRQDVPPACAAIDSDNMEFFGCLLAHSGLPILHVDQGFLRVKADPDQVWEALSGQPSDPARSAHYLK